MPTTSPAILNNGPPLLPGEIGAVICKYLPTFPSTVRIPLIMPFETVDSSESGLPTPFSHCFTNGHSVPCDFRPSGCGQLFGSLHASTTAARSNSTPASIVTSTITKVTAGKLYLQFVARVA
jgi:hypothetical protein